jgi:competence protein ComEC
MIGVVLLGVLFDHPALTMRTLTIAALVVLLFARESIVHPSFQMSFAATLALIAGYERGAIKLRGRADTSLGALWDRRVPERSSTIDPSVFTVRTPLGC